MPKKRKKTFDEREEIRKKNKEFIESLKNNLFDGIQQYRDVLHFPTKSPSTVMKKIGFAYMREIPELLFDPSKLENIEYDILDKKKYDMYLTKIIKLFPTNIQKKYIDTILLASTKK